MEMEYNLEKMFLTIFNNMDRISEAVIAENNFSYYFRYKDNFLFYLSRELNSFKYTFRFFPEQSAENINDLNGLSSLSDFESFTFTVVLNHDITSKPDLTNIAIPAQGDRILDHLQELSNNNFNNFNQGNIISIEDLNEQFYE